MRHSIVTPLRTSATLACVTLIFLAAACEGDDILPPGTPTGNGSVASEIGVWSGHEQKVPVGTQTTVAVRVTDSTARPVSGVTVSFFATDGTLGSTTATSDGNGVASTTFTASSAAKPDTVTATIPNSVNMAQVVVDAILN